MRRTSGLLAWCASAVFAAVLSAAGCGDVDLNQGSAGGSKGPEMRMTISTGRPASGSASSMAQSTPTTGLATFPKPPCGPGLACIIANTGCEGACDPVDALITSCARCEDGVLADCSQRACQP